MAVHAAHQQYSENFVGLSLCGGASQDWVMDIGSSGLCDLYPLSLQQQQQEEIMMRNQILGQVVDPPLSTPSSYNLGFYQAIGLQAEKQRQEIDRLIAIQNERLRLALQQQRKQQVSALLARLESKAQYMLRQKDEDLAKARRKAMELEECIRKVEMENEAWQKVAKEKESMVMALNKTLEQVRENVCIFSSEAAEDAESCCQSCPHEVSKTEEEERKMLCKACNSRTSCVLFLPCRHLCSCLACEAFLDSCPVCKSVKKACIEVFMV